MGRRTRSLIVILFCVSVSAAERNCPIAIEHLFPKKEIVKIFNRGLLVSSSIEIANRYECRYGGIRIQMSVRNKKARTGGASHVETQKAICRDSLDCTWVDGLGDGMWHPKSGRTAESFCGDYSIWIDSPGGEAVSVMNLMAGKECPTPPKVVVKAVPAKKSSEFKVQSVRFFEVENGKKVEVAKERVPTGREKLTCDPKSLFEPLEFDFEISGQGLKDAIASIDSSTIKILEVSNKSDVRIAGKIRVYPSTPQNEFEFLVKKGAELQKLKFSTEISGTQYLSFQTRKFTVPISFVGNWPIRPYDKEEGGIAEIPRIETNILLGLDEIATPKYKALGISIRAYSDECWKSRSSSNEIAILADLPAAGQPLNIAKSILNQAATKLLASADKSFHDQWSEIVNPPAKPGDPKPDPKDKPKKMDPLPTIPAFVEAVAFDPASASESLKFNDIAHNKKLKLLRENGFLR